MRSLKALAPIVLRLFLGAVFTTFGLAGFIQFMPRPVHPPAAQALHEAFVATGYMMPLIKGTEVVVGLLFLSGRFVPLALTVLAPVLVNIVLFHVFLAPAGFPLILPIVFAELGLAWMYRDAFTPLLRSRPATTASDIAPRAPASSSAPSSASSAPVSV